MTNNNDLEKNLFRAPPSYKPVDKISSNDDLLESGGVIPEATPNAGYQLDPKSITTCHICKGWIAIHSHYLEYNDIAVGYKVEVHKVGILLTEGLTWKQTFFKFPNIIYTYDKIVDKKEVYYKSLNNTSTPTSYEDPDVAIENGNARVILGGKDGYDAGFYYLKIYPKINHLKVLINPHQDKNGRYSIATEKLFWSTGEFLDQYKQPPVGFNTKHEYWLTPAFAVFGGNKNNPLKLELAWIDYATKEKRNDVIIKNGANAVHPLIRYRSFILLNKSDELNSYVTIVQGVRTIAEQNALYAKGRDVSGKIIDSQKVVTKARGGSSYHNYGLAIDVADLSGGTFKAPPKIVVDIGDQLNLEWGGRWKFVDKPHFQDSFGLSVKQLLAKYNNNQFFKYRGVDYVKID